MNIVSVKNKLHFVALEKTIRKRINKTNDIVEKPIINRNQLLGFPYSFYQDQFRKDNNSTKIQTNSKAYKKNGKIDEEAVQNHVHFALAFHQKELAEQVINKLDAENPLNHAQILPLIHYDTYDVVSNEFVRHEPQSEEYIDKNGKSIILCEPDRILILEKKESIVLDEKKSKIQTRTKDNKMIIPLSREKRNKNKRSQRQLFSSWEAYDAMFEDNMKNNGELSGEESDNEEYDELNQKFNNVFPFLDKMSPYRIQSSQQKKKNQVIQTTRSFQSKTTSNIQFYTLDIIDALDFVLMNNLGLSLVKQIDIEEKKFIHLNVDLIHPCHEQNIIKNSLEMLYQK